MDAIRVRRVAKAISPLATDVLLVVNKRLLPLRLPCPTVSATGRSYGFGSRSVCRATLSAAPGVSSAASRRAVPDLGGLARRVVSPAGGRRAARDTAMVRRRLHHGPRRVLPDRPLVLRPVRHQLTATDRHAAPRDGRPHPLPPRPDGDPATTHPPILPPH